MSRKNFPKSCSTSFEVIPWDLIADEILPRLPNKSLARFKCVSQLWNSHISNFIENSNPVFFCLVSNTETEYACYFLRGNRFIRLEHVPQSFRFLRPFGSCNGITGFVKRPTELFVKTMVLWNPSVANVEEPRQQQRHSFLCIDSPYRKCFTELCVAIGHDLTDGYKVVHVGYGGQGKRSRPTAHVYSPKSREWKPIDIDENIGRLLCIDNDELQPNLSWMPRCSANGRWVHWLANYEDCWDSTTGKIRRRMLLSFNRSDEAFSVVNLPVCWANLHVELASFVGDNFVSVFVHDKKYSPVADYFVWVMKKYGVEDSWTMTKFKICLGKRGRPLGCLDKYRLLFLLDCGKILLYDTKTEEKVSSKS